MAISEFTVGLDDENGLAKMPPYPLVLSPVWYDWTDRGGPNQASVRVTGPIHALWTSLNWLAYRLTIYNRNNEPVWWGIVEEAMVSTGTLQVGLSLRDMANSVTVAYSTRAADGTLERQTTAAATNDDSINRFGTKELLLSLSDVSASAAEAKRDSILEAVGRPVASIRMERGYPVEAMLTCSGYMSTLDWEYCSNPLGLVEHEDGSAPQSMGVGGTATTIGFDTNKRIIFDVGTGLFAGTTFKVSGSSSNNGTHTSTEVREQADETLTASTIQFSESGGSDDDDIYDSANTFDNFRVDDVIQVEGSSSNDGIYEIKTYKDDGHMELDPAVLVYEAAGSSVTLRRASYVRVEDNVVEEDAGASVTVTGYGEKVAQSFQLPTTGSWTVGSIALKLAQSGGPTDNVRVGVHSDSGGDPGTELDFGTMAGTDLTEQVDWVEIDLNNTATLSASTTYWVVVSRSGSNSLDDYYVTAVDEGLGYTDGSLKLYDGSAWQTRATDADLSFRVFGSQETTEQIGDLSNNVGLIAGVHVLDASGVYSKQYRDGDTTVLDEVIDLLDIGAVDGDRLVALVTRDRYLSIRDEPLASLYTYCELDAEGRLYTRSGLPWEHGRLPVGQWVKLRDIPATGENFAAVSPMYVQRAEFDVESGTVILEPRGMRSPWEMALVRQG